MVALGTVLVILGGLAIAAAIFVSEGTAKILGVELNAMSIYLFGVASGVAVLFGLSLMKSGTKRAMHQRKERKKMDDLSIKLEEAQAERKRDAEGA